MIDLSIDLLILIFFFSKIITILKKTEKRRLYSTCTK